MRQLTSVVIAFCFVVVALTSAVDVVRGGGPKSETDRQIDAILAKLRNKRWFEFGKKEVKLSPEETLEQLNELVRLSADGQKMGYGLAKRLIGVSEISEENCNIGHMNGRLKTIKDYRGESDNLEAYLKHWARKQLALCAGPVEEAASKISAERKQEIKELGALINASEMERLRWRYLSEADRECTADGILKYLASKGQLSEPDTSEEYFMKAYMSVIKPLCDMKQFTPNKMTNIFRSFLKAPDLLTEVSQEVRDMAEMHRTCFAVSVAYWRTYEMRKCLLTEEEALHFKCWYDSPPILRLVRD